jgi:hypothetical protein
LERENEPGGLASAFEAVAGVGLAELPGAMAREPPLSPDCRGCGHLRVAAFERSGDWINRPLSGVGHGRPSDLEGVLVVAIASPSGQINKASEGRLSHELSDADAQLGALGLEGLPQVGPEANGGLMHLPNRHA